MRRLHFVPTAVFLLLSLCHRSVWAESLSVESQANLNQLTVGQSFAVEVHLAGLPSGESLDPGFVDVAFSTFSAQSSGRVADNGTFVTVHLTARANGPGALRSTTYASAGTFAARWNVLN